MSFEQIEKFLCLKPSTTQGLSRGIFRTHVARVTCPETCLKVCQLQGPKSPKTGLIWFDSQLGLLVGPLSFQKIYVTPMGEFSTLIEATGEVCQANSPFIFDMHISQLHNDLFQIHSKIHKFVLGLGLISFESFQTLLS